MGWRRETQAALLGWILSGKGAQSPFENLRACSSPQSWKPGSASCPRARSLGGEGSSTEGDGYHRGRGSEVCRGGGRRRRGKVIRWRPEGKMDAETQAERSVGMEVWDRGR